MTSLNFLNDTPERAFRKLERDLTLLNPELNLRPYKNMTPRRLGEAINKLESETKAIVRESQYGSWLTDDSYVEKKLLQDALSCLKEYKEKRRVEESLIPGFSYYRKVKQFGPIMVGERCYFREDATPLWAQFKMPTVLAKAIEVMRHGNDDDFKTIYVEMANGRLDALDRVSLKHIVESDKEALADIEKYCDKRWSGPWPWDMPSPYALREMIEDRLEMTYNNIREMQIDFDKIVVRLNETEMDKYEVVAAAEEMSNKIEKMVQEIARLGGEGIMKLKDQTRVALGDEAAEKIEDRFLQPVRQAADALSQLRAALEQNIEELKGAANDVPTGDLGTGEIPGDMGGDEIGTGLGGDELSDELADTTIDGEGEERPMKQM